jgi:sulfate adenylyltransferase subunit 2
MRILLRELKPLINESVTIFRECHAKFDKPAILWSTGKDSTAMLELCREAFLGVVPFDVIFIDTGFHFPQTYAFVDRISAEWFLPLRIARNNLSLLVENMNPKTYSSFDCCYKLKTMALKRLVEQEQYDALIVGIRADEHGIRAKERVFSPRDSKWHWNVIREKTAEEMKEGDAPVVSLQDTELTGWGIYATDFGEDCAHVRVHPILHWFEIDIWNFIKSRNIPVNPLYRAINHKRYRSLGCIPCTNPIESESRTSNEILEEVYYSPKSEREGRSSTKGETMERLRALGYP